MPKTKLPCPTVVRKLVRYDPSTGKLFWLARGSCWFSDGYRSAVGNMNNWNALYAGTEAFKQVSTSGYAHGSIFGVKITAHRVVWAICHGDWPVDQIDHVNGDKLDNRLENLRQVDRSGNAKNQKLSTRNRSGRVGVSWVARRSKWAAQIRSNGIQYNLGTFETFEEAVAVRAAAELEHGFHKNHGRSENENSIRNSQAARDLGSQAARKPAGHMPRVQPAPAQEKRPVSERDVQAGRGAMALLAL